MVGDELIDNLRADQQVQLGLRETWREGTGCRSASREGEHRRRRVAVGRNGTGAWEERTHRLRAVRAGAAVSPTRKAQVQDRSRVERLTCCYHDWALSDSVEHERVVAGWRRQRWCRGRPETAGEASERRPTFDRHRSPFNPSRRSQSDLYKAEDTWKCAGASEDTMMLC